MPDPEQPTQHPLVVAITGASGSAYAVRLLQVLLAQGLRIHAVCSEAASQVALRELGVPYPKPGDTAGWSRFLGKALRTPAVADWGFQRTADEDDRVRIAAEEHLRVCGLRDFSSGIASGSCLTGGMVICPCSMGTLASIASGASANLIHRAADVHLKERRPLVLVPRETPLGTIGIRNLLCVSEAGATVMPAAPGLYHQPSCIADLVDFVVARICDHLQVPNTLVRRWGDSA